VGWISRNNLSYSCNRSNVATTPSDSFQNPMTDQFGLTSSTRLKPWGSPLGVEPTETERFAGSLSRWTMTCVSGCASTAPASDSGFENLPKARLPIFSAPFLSALSSSPHSGHSKRIGCMTAGCSMLEWTQSKPTVTTGPSFQQNTATSNLQTNLPTTTKKSRTSRLPSRSNTP
jgi:hypothetical protein